MVYILTKNIFTKPGKYAAYSKQMTPQVKPHTLCICCEIGSQRLEVKGDLQTTIITFSVQCLNSRKSNHSPLIQNIYKRNANGISNRTLKHLYMLK
jgi:hypothetical protein